MHLLQITERYRNEIDGARSDLEQQLQQFNDGVPDTVGLEIIDHLKPVQTRLEKLEKEMQQVKIQQQQLSQGGSGTTSAATSPTAAGSASSAHNALRLTLTIVERCFF